MGRSSHTNHGTGGVPPGSSRLLHHTGTTADHDAETRCMVETGSTVPGTANASFRTSGPHAENSVERGAASPPRGYQRPGSHRVISCETQGKGNPLEGRARDSRLLKLPPASGGVDSCELEAHVAAFVACLLNSQQDSTSQHPRKLGTGAQTPRTGLRKPEPNLAHRLPPGPPMPDLHGPDESCGTDPFECPSGNSAPGARFPSDPLLPESRGSAHAACPEREDRDSGGNLPAFAGSNKLSSAGSGARSGKKTRPAWALTEEKARQHEQAEEDNLLGFLGSLDLERFAPELTEAISFAEVSDQSSTSLQGPPFFSPLFPACLLAKTAWPQ